MAGASELDFTNFALFAYTGAFCWAAMFIALGYFLGEEWNQVMQSLHETKLLIIALAAVLILGYVFFGYLRRRRLKHA